MCVFEHCFCFLYGGIVSVLRRVFFFFVWSAPGLFDCRDCDFWVDFRCFRYLLLGCFLVRIVPPAVLFSWLCSFSVSWRFGGFSTNADVLVGSLLVVSVPDCGVFCVCAPFCHVVLCGVFLKVFSVRGELGKKNVTRNLRVPPIITSALVFLVWRRTHSIFLPPSYLVSFCDFKLFFFILLFYFFPFRGSGWFSFVFVWGCRVWGVLLLCCVRFVLFAIVLIG